ncbi:phospholipid-binding lipoprotein MlaA [Chitinivorax tropicus]|uniref:Phospholipid-binding lipoprotein MlaA n=1 Tax=Chitinivorax tropicus TaxID=714531 RepID=A0A840MQW5_9PROT|nr:VacJ family lipoprotein [Chitinivorax tropicus]MBB5019487.1 phospholipid-binding lipoprotein MlaA [Chitinivorax tropicus]
MRYPLILLLSALIAVLTGCATAPDKRDPFEPFNRKVYAFNETADTAVIKPAAEAYTKVVPSPVRAGVHNFLGNLKEISYLVNNLLQGKVEGAAISMGRFTFNSTLGLAGLIDLMTPVGFPARPEDFGQTLGKWGVKPGPYLVLPLFGPSTLRDTAGMVADTATSINAPASEPAARYGVLAIGAVDKRAELLGASEVLDSAALDPYTFLRDAYLQKRIAEIYDGNPPSTVDPDDPFADDSKASQPASPPAP